MEKNIKNNLLLDFYGAMLTEKQKEIMRLYFECDASLSEIAAELNTSRQAVYDSVKGSISLLETYEQKLKCVDRYLSNREIMLEVKGQLEMLKDNESDAEKSKVLLIIQEQIEKVLKNQ